MKIKMNGKTYEAAYGELDCTGKWVPSNNGKVLIALIDNMAEELASLLGDLPVDWSPIYEPARFGVEIIEA